MPRWRTDTPLFRKALAVVALWILAWAVIGFWNHRAVQPYDRRAGYRETMEQCADDRLDTSPAGVMTSRPPTRREMFACTERARTFYLEAEDGEQRQVAIWTLAWALLPSLFVLLFAAFAENKWRRS